MNLIDLTPEGLTSKLAVLIVALVFDMLIGEPPERIHPTVIVGKAIERLRRANSKSNARLYGFVLASALVLSAAALTYVLLELTRTQLGHVAYLVLGGLILKTSFAIRSMSLHIRPVREALEKGDIHSARATLSKIVRARYRRAYSGLCASAAIESIAEGTVDGIVSPLFYFFLLGVPGAVAFRAVNTLDSMVGYKYEPYTKIGWFSAKLDTVANYIPARLTGTIMIAAGAIMGRDWRSSISILRRDHSLTESVNAGWPMSAMAGAIGVQLQKKGSYQLGGQRRLPNYTDISPALQIMVLTTIIFLIAAAVPCFTITFLFVS